MTYREFKRHNDTSKVMSNMTVGRVTNVNLITETCELNVGDRKSIISIGQLVRDIVYDGMGAISNPSLLQRWRGFSK